MPFINDIQKLEPGNKIRLIEVDITKFAPNTDVMRFHAHEIPYTDAEIKAAGNDATKLPAKSIWFNGEEYKAYPYQVTGISSSSDGQTAEPTLSVANLNGVISALCIHYDDLVQARVTIIDTFSHYLDAKNFPGGNSTADPSQKYTQLWYIDSKITEDNEVIEFKLSSPVDLQGLQIPTRQIMGLCTWACRGQYRGAPGEGGCSYTGTNYFNALGGVETDRANDVCSGLLTDCKKRFGKDNPLPFGGFPGANLVRR
ncbi:TPA: phage minor tail protein L [Klebsiella variicola subsp. variicola]|nr:phage minor tail protein L [Klebsiella variicola subsp. variicola]